jgi:hypothetical protein
LAFTEHDEKYQKIEAELQGKCRLFDIAAVVIGEELKQNEIKGKAWVEAKIKNNTDYVFMQPIVTFMTTEDNQDAQNGKGKRPPEIGIMLMSSSDNLSHWKPGETIMLDGEIDPSSEDIPSYELKFFDYLTKVPDFAVDVPMCIDDYVSTLWIGSPCISGIDKDIPEHVPFESLQPSWPADKIESGIDGSAKPDYAASEDFLLLPSTERVEPYSSSDNSSQHDETDEAIDSIKISCPQATGLKYERDVSSQDEKNSNSFDGGHQITQDNSDEIVKKDKSMSSISRWIILLSGVIIASLFISNLFIGKGYRQSFERRTLHVSSPKSIAPENGTDRKQADLQRRKEPGNRSRVETKTPQKNKQNTDLRQTVAIRKASANRNLQKSKSNKRSRQNLLAAGRYSILTSLTVYKKGRGTVTDIGGGALIDCGSICSTFVNGVLYLAATPDAEYLFVKWVGCDSVAVNKVCMVKMVNRDRAITAVFEGVAR